MADSLFPHIKKAVEDFLIDQEGNIPRGKVLSVGSMLLILGMLLADQALATHGSHVSHGSHGSHESHTSGSRHVSHASHASHGSHSNSYASHSSHSSHTSSISRHVSHASHASSSYHSSAAHSNATPTIATLNDIKAPDTVAPPQLPNLPTTELPPDTTPAN